MWQRASGDMRPALFSSPFNGQQALHVPRVKPHVTRRVTKSNQPHPYFTHNFGIRISTTCNALDLRYLLIYTFTSSKMWEYIMQLATHRHY